MNQIPTDGKCQRCRKEPAATSMSIFNTQHCCIPCLELEKRHPQFKYAVKVELDAVENKNYNFPGVGLPAGYDKWALDQR